MKRPQPLVLLLLSVSSVFGQLDPEGWRVISVSSENVITGELARYAIDGDPESQWHTQWHNTRGIPAAAPPHQITVDLGREHALTGFRYRARAHGEGGLPREYVVELSRDLTNWKIVADGAFEFHNPMTPHAAFGWAQAEKARYLRFTVLSLQNQTSERETEPGLVVGEIDLATSETSLVPTTLIPLPQSREWNYGGYHWVKRHRDLLAYTKEHQPRLIFLGDSITHRWGAPPYDETPRTGEAVWQKYYSQRNAMSLGYGWDRVENMLWRIQHGELDATNPRLVILMAGTNNLGVNTPSEIAAGLSRLCEEIHRKKPDALILLLGIFPRGIGPDFPGLKETNQLLAALSQRSYVEFKDISEAFLDEDGTLSRIVMPDLLHPSEEGYRRWARAIEADVAKFLGDHLVKE